VGIKSVRQDPNGDPVATGKTRPSSTPTRALTTGREPLGDPVIATAIPGRLLHHCKVVNIKGYSYLHKEHQTVKEQLKEQDDNQPG